MACATSIFGQPSRRGVSLNFGCHEPVKNKFYTRVTAATAGTGKRGDTIVKTNTKIWLAGVAALMATTSMVQAQDLAALPTWGSRARLVRQHAFPSASYMRGTYAPGSRLPLMVLYVIRALRGARKWMGHS